MSRTLVSYGEAIVAVAATAWLTSAVLPMVGLASCALLFLLPVLLAASRGGFGPGLTAAIGGAGAYNYFLLEPRFTFGVHQLDNLISVAVLGAVAVVTSRLATRLMAREAEANARAQASAEEAAFSALLASRSADAALGEGLAFLSARFGPVQLVEGPFDEPNTSPLSALDQSAAAWAMHNGDSTGHGTEVMAAADWTFIPLTPRHHADRVVAALARPTDGTTRTSAQLDHVRRLCALLGQCHDRAALDAERRERELLEQSEHLRRTFLASLAHDFRTPLTVIGGRLALLAQHSPDAREALAATHRLERMMADLVGAARMEAGSLVIVRESLDLVDIVSAACDRLVLPTAIVLRRAIPADLPLVVGDPVLLQHILANLIDNAVRHARTEVHVTAGVQDDGQVLLAVEDDGPGVPESERDRIFERFIRIDGGDRTHGSGLGLSIVKGFADAMGISASVADRAGGGARFVLSVPSAREAQA